MDALTTASLFAPLAGAALSPLLVRMLGHHAAWLLALFLFVPFVGFAAHIEAVSAGTAIAGGFAWIPTLGVDFAWRLDGLSLTFALLISGIGTLTITSSDETTRGAPLVIRDVEYARERREKLRELVSNARRLRGVREIDMVQEDLRG